MIDKLAKPVALAAFITMIGAAPALADAIDGNWCSTVQVKQLSIAGPNITTPAGTPTTGNYSRHAFNYAAPAGDPDAGQAVDMVLLNEEEVQISFNGGTPEVWKRCELIS